MRKITILAALLLLVPAMAQAKSLEDLLVEKGVVTRSEVTGVTQGAMADGTKVYWNKGTRLEFPEQGFATQIYTKFKAAYSYVDYDNDKTGSEQKDLSGVNVGVARIGIKGSALNSEFKYKMEADLAGNGGDVLRDVFVDWTPCDWGGMRMGQWKTETSRQFNTSTSQLQFWERSRATQLVNAGRQPGVGGMFESEDGMWSASASIRNGRSVGEGRNNPPADDNIAFGVAGRVNAMGEIDPYDETDVNHSDEFGLTLGAAYFGETDRAGSGTFEKANTNTVSADTLMKLEGWSLGAEYLYQQVDPKGDDLLSGETGNLNSFYVQTGYFVLPKELEVAVRYDYADCDNGKAIGNGDDCAGTDNWQGFDVALNYYWWGHHIKSQLQYTYLKQEFADNVDGNSEKFSRVLLGVSSWW